MSELSKPQKLSAKQRRKKEQRNQLKIVASIVSLVGLVVLLVIGWNWWRDNRASIEPGDQRVIAVVGDDEVEIPPYAACELDDDDCKLGEPFELDFQGREDVTLKIPQDVYDHDWALLNVYDGADDQNNQYHKAYETPELKIHAESSDRDKAGKHRQLTVVEIHSLLIGHDEQGEETPVTTIWSIAPVNTKSSPGTGDK